MSIWKAYLNIMYNKRLNKAMLKSFLKMFLIPFSLRRGSTKNSRLLIKSAEEKNYFKGPLQEQRLIMEMWFTTTMG